MDKITIPDGTWANPIIKGTVRGDVPNLCSALSEILTNPCTAALAKTIRTQSTSTLTQVNRTIKFDNWRLNDYIQSQVYGMPASTSSTIYEQLLPKLNSVDLDSECTIQPLDTNTLFTGITVV